MTMIQAYQMTVRNQPFERTSYPVPALQPGEALVQVAGCGVCHTDISFWHHGVPTKKELPLTLGHEISGVVVDGPLDLIGKSVVIPAVLPCGECDLCRTGRSNICQKQRMPGNDFHGGFASHIVVPSRFLAVVPEAVLARYKLEELAVVADAVSTPLQVIEKSGLKSGDLAIVIGIGGVGLYAALLARIAGARVVALDLSQARLDLLSQAGITSTLNTGGLSIKEIKDKVKAIGKELGASPYGWKIYEVSGTAAGQELGFALLGIAGVLSVVGFTLDKLELRLSNLMAFDAQVIGTWGCRPELYGEAIRMVGDGRLNLAPFTKTHPLSQINDVFQQALEHKLLQRAVLVPDF
ncbi:6-hydroxycyclohex-1-ene-1-carbonyl-CoA dehydrogenase [candidate division KSB1 bacterium]|nr:6-hydroxycyclohex-1-ene-1-carbonyl-CoA dehydrogenase [candidate division KSB1 bacterium]